MGVKRERMGLGKKSGKFRGWGQGGRQKSMVLKGGKDGTRRKRIFSGKIL